MSMRNGNYPKALIRFYLEKFKTKEGLFQFFVGGAVWGFAIIEFNQLVYQFLYNLFSFLKIDLAIRIVAYWAFSIVAVFVNLGIVYAINHIYDFLWNLVKKM